MKGGDIGHKKCRETVDKMILWSPPTLSSLALGSMCDLYPV
jgi:hypothetical protein